MRRCGWLKTVVVLVGVLEAARPMKATTASSYAVTVNTAGLVGHPAGPFSVLLALTDGSGLADANNSITVTNADFGGGNGLGSSVLFGGANGALETGLTITDTSPLNLFSEAFSPGQFLRFTLTVTTNDDDGGIPDRVVFYILDRSGKPIPTLS